MSFSNNSEKELTRLPPLFSVIPQGIFRFFLWIVAVSGIDLLFVTVMALILATTVLAYGLPLRLAQESVLYPVGMMFFLLLTRSALWVYRHWRDHPENFPWQTIFVHTLRDWIPFILIDLIYENLRDLSRFFYTHDIAGTLMAWDIMLFGTELTQWSQRFFDPLLTDAMAFVYALYFIFPLLLMYFLSYRNKRSEMREIALALSLTFLIGFLGYIFFPCSPPRYFLADHYTNPVKLYGPYIFTPLQAKWDTLSVIPAGAFPSLHVGISTIALFYAFRFRNWSRMDYALYLLYLPLIVSLWVSTVYLRHHWFIDILAGWMLALLSSWVASFLTTSWEGLRRRFGFYQND